MKWGAILLAWGCLISSASSATFCVATNGIPADPWNSWTKAFTNIQEALDTATNGDVIYLAGQTFKLPTLLSWSNRASGVSIRGGYAADNAADFPGSNNPALWPTLILRGSSMTNRFMTLSGVMNGAIQGVTFQGGSVVSNVSSAYGGALYLGNCINCTIVSCSFISNSVASGGANGYGGGLYFFNCTNCSVVSATIMGNTISGATGNSQSYGAGLCQEQGILLVSNCSIRANLKTASGDNAYGTGVAVLSGTQTLWGCTISHNRTIPAGTGNGGGLWSAGTVRMRNCLIGGNIARVNGGGIYISAGSASIENCTVAYNSIHGICRNSGSVAVTNSIIWGNVDDVTGTVTLVWTDVGDGDNAGTNGCFSADPVFEYGAYLATNSPCQKVGTNAASYWNLTNATTRIDGLWDTNLNVNLGYHYPTGFDLTYADVYVATNGDNGNSGTLSTAPLQTITKALSVATAGTHVHIASGSYTNGFETLPLAINNKPGLQLLGTNRDTTIISGLGAKQVIAIQDSICSLVRISDLTITGGAGTDGRGLYLSNCGPVDINSCVITNNRTAAATGGGLYVDYSRPVTIRNCVIQDNTNGVGSFRVASSGGGIYLGSGMGSVSISNCMVQRNTANVREQSANGSAIYVGSGSIVIYYTVLSNNKMSGDHIVSNGAIYNLGRLQLTNCLLRGNASSSAVYAVSGSLTVDNCTFAYNSPMGIYNAGGTTRAANSIFWGNTVDIGGSGGNVSVTYCCLQSGLSNNVSGNNANDPLFVDPIFCHLQSKQGYYTNGYFSGGGWATGGLSNSPQIDAGDPFADCSREPLPNGEHINLGAYGNTEVASLTDISSPITLPVVTNLGATLVGHRTVRLNGQVTDTGGNAPQCGFDYWVVDSASTSTVMLGQFQDSFFANVTDLTPGTAYQFLAIASNSAGPVRSDVKTFNTHPVADGLYVTTNGSNSAGSTWSSGYTDLQTALSVAEPGDTIYLAGQTFAASPGGFLQSSLYTWQGNSNVTIRGGYSAATNNPVLPGTNNPDLWPTVMVRTSGTCRLMQITGVTNGWLEGVTFTGGDNADNGSGLYIANCTNLALVHCVISNNHSTAARGGGIYIDNSGPVTVSNTLIQGNVIGLGTFRLDSYGGGMYLGAGMGTVGIFNSVLHNNTVNVRERSAYGSGIYLSSGTIGIYNSTFSSNNMSGDNITYRGVVYNEATLRLRNCLLYTNNTSGAIYAAGGSFSLENCTLAYNSGAAVIRAGGTGVSSNSIFWGHSSDITGGGVVLGYCDFQSGLSNTVNGCISADPLFVNSATKDFKLLPGSPCIDTGFNQFWMDNAIELGGGKRISHGVVDMGAYESLPSFIGTLMTIQ